VGQAATGTHAGDAESGFVDQLQSQSWSDALCGLPSPLTEEVPGAQSKQLRGKQPDAEEITRNLVRQELSHPPFQALGVAWFGFDAVLGDLSCDRRRFRAWGVAVEFFFECRIPR
jgi:hypothetical protein